MGEWTGRTAVVTGASRGIGRATAIALAAAGARTVLLARDATDLAATAEACDQKPGPPVVLPVDLTDPEALGRAAAQAVGAVDGRLDLLANVAGGHLRIAALADLEDEDWAASHDLHVMAPVRLAQALLDALRTGRGAVVNVGSVAAGRGVSHGAAYAAAKAALVSVTKTMAVEWARYGVRAIVVEPGLVDTHFYDPETEGAIVEKMVAQVPTRSAITPEAVARLIVHVGSPESRDMTGSVIRIDGGLSAKL